MDAINQMLVGYLLNSFWQITVIAILVLICSAFLRRVPGRHRHILWVLCLSVCVIAPAATVLMQGRTASKTEASAQIARDKQAPSATSRRGGWSFLSFGVRSHPVQFAQGLVNVLAWSYLGLLCSRCLKLGWIYRRTSRIRRFAYARAMPAATEGAAETCQRFFRIPYISVLCSDEITSPSTLGWSRPVLLMPSAFFTDAIAEDDVVCALSHEMAHIRRHDFLLNLLYEAISIPLCLHPGTSFIKARIAQTRELACDEMAARLLASRKQYARSLLNLAQKMFAAAPSTKTNYAMGLFDTHALEDRIMNILKVPRNFSHARMATAVAAVCGVSILSCAFSLRVAANAVPADTQRFVGTWVTKYKGQTFITFNLRSVNGKLGGSCVHVDRLDALSDGSLIPSSDQFTEQEIVEIRVNGNKLELHIGGHDSIYAEFTLKGTNDADVMMVGDPRDSPGSSPDQGPPQKKPWHFQRVADSK